MVRSVHIIYSSTSGHTEHVVDTLIAYAADHAADVRFIKQKAEVSTPEDLMKSDVLLLACGTWNTGNAEGQLSPYMDEFIRKRAQDVDLAGKPATAIGLGDDRYFYKAKAADHLVTFITTHKGTLFYPALKLLNEPYGQEEKIELWADEFLKAISALPSPSAF